MTVKVITDSTSDISSEMAAGIEYQAIPEDFTSVYSEYLAESKTLMKEEEDGSQIA